MVLPLLRGSLHKGRFTRQVFWMVFPSENIDTFGKWSAGNVWNVNMQQTVTLPPRAAHLLERLYTSQNVLASLQHLMAGSTCWLLTAVNMHICILVRMLSVPLPAAVTSSLPILRQGPQSLCWLLRFTAGWRTLSWAISSRDVSQQRGGWRHCRHGPRRDVPLQWRSLCSRRRHQGVLHHLYTRWQHIMLLCSWSGLKGKNAYNMQHSVEFSHYRSDLLPVLFVFAVIKIKLSTVITFMSY